MADRAPSVLRPPIVAQPKTKSIKGSDTSDAYSGVSTQQLTTSIDGTIERIERDAELAVDCSRSSIDTLRNDDARRVVRFTAPHLRARQAWINLIEHSINIKR